MVEAGFPDMTERQWYVMRDLKRTNAKVFMYEQLRDAGFEVFTPLVWKVDRRHERVQVPFIPDLLFVHDTPSNLSPMVEQSPTLQYRFARGGGYHVPMVVPEADMNRFIHAVENTRSTVYYKPEEVTPAMIGRRIRIVGGTLDGYEGGLVSIHGNRTKRLLVELTGFFAAGVEVEPNFITFL